MAHYSLKLLKDCSKNEQPVFVGFGFNCNIGPLTLSLIAAHTVLEASCLCLSTPKYLEVSFVLTADELKLPHVEIYSLHPSV